jgi:hypothetical protein
MFGDYTKLIENILTEGVALKNTNKIVFDAIIEVFFDMLMSGKAVSVFPEFNMSGTNTEQASKIIKYIESKGYRGKKKLDLFSNMDKQDTFTTVTRQYGNEYKVVDKNAFAKVFTLKFNIRASQDKFVSKFNDMVSQNINAQTIKKGLADIINKGK